MRQYIVEFFDYKRHPAKLNQHLVWAMSEADAIKKAREMWPELAVASSPIRAALPEHPSLEFK